MGQQRACCRDEPLCCLCRLLGFLGASRVRRQVRVLQLGAATPENPERPEAIAELSPHRLFNRVMAAAGGGAQPLLREQGDAGEARGVVGQDIGTVRVADISPVAVVAVLRACSSSGAPSAAAPDTRSSSPREMSCSTSVSPRAHLGIAGPPRPADRRRGAVPVGDEDTHERAGLDLPHERVGRQPPRLS